MSAQSIYVVLRDNGGGSGGGGDVPKIMGFRECADDVLCLAKSEVDFLSHTTVQWAEAVKEARLHKVTEGLGFLPRCSFSMF